MVVVEEREGRGEGAGGAGRGKGEGRGDAGVVYRYQAPPQKMWGDKRVVHEMGGGGC